MLLLMIERPGNHVWNAPAMAHAGNSIFDIIEK